ncbi:GntR family transcriptional regulator [Streptomyces sp. NPDC047017]|uniref:GntR family transcriptional regulator n=1 Tax=Streptomyces sp. NPDC047017 TaxID=3155024 RepID=UPI0033D0E693
MKQDAQDSAAVTATTRTGVPRARTGDGPPRTPRQQSPAARGGERGAPEGDGIRGEHTHGEYAPGGRMGEGRAGVGAAAPGARPAVVRRSSVRGQVLDALRAALVTGELRPGEVYSAPALGERFGVSATPVREAMQQLTLEGAVEVVLNRGFRVVERGARELAELAEVRALIEVPVLLRLVATVPVERWAELRPLAEAGVRAASSGCRAAYADTDRAFHRAVLSLAGNEQLLRIAEDLHRRTQCPSTDGPGRPARAELIADAAEHTALLDALIARDQAAVRALADAHFTTPR